MGIVGERPESGLRIDVERARAGGGAATEGPPWTYEGHVTTPNARVAVRAVVEASGSVTVSLEDANEELAEKVKLILRASYKHAQTERSEQATPDAPAAPPRRIQRWRAT